MDSKDLNELFKILRRNGARITIELYPTTAPLGLTVAPTLPLNNNPFEEHAAQKRDYTLERLEREAKKADEESTQHESDIDLVRTTSPKDFFPQSGDE